MLSVETTRTHFHRLVQTKLNHYLNFNVTSPIIAEALEKLKNALSFLNSNKDTPQLQNDEETKTEAIDVPEPSAQTNQSMDKEDDLNMETNTCSLPQNEKESKEEADEQEPSATTNQTKDQKEQEPNTPATLVIDEKTLKPLVQAIMEAMKNGDNNQDELTSKQLNEKAESKSENLSAPDLQANQTENKLFEGHVEYKEGTTGITFDTLLIPYLCGAKSIQIEDAYLQNYWQIRNLDELLQGLAKVKKPETEIDVTVITKYNETPDFRNKQEEYLDQIYDGFMSAGIHLTYRFDKSIHDRKITTDTGWIIVLGRGLDIFQSYDGKKAFCIKNSLQSFRACKRFTITYIRNQGEG